MTHVLLFCPHQANGHRLIGQARNLTRFLDRFGHAPSLVISCAHSRCRFGAYFQTPDEPRVPGAILPRRPLASQRRGLDSVVESALQDGSSMFANLWGATHAPDP